MAAADAVALPERKPNGAIYVGERHVGRVSFVHASSSRMFAYCRVHQCYKGIALSKGPHLSGAIKWVAACLRSDVNSREQHERLWLDMVMNP